MKQTNALEDSCFYLVRELYERNLFCGDSSCMFRAAHKRTGMHTNGGCRCLDSIGIPHFMRGYLTRIIRYVQQRHEKWGDDTRFLTQTQELKTNEEKS